MSAATLPDPDLSDLAARTDHALPIAHVPGEVTLSPFKLAWNGSLVASLLVAPWMFDAQVAAVTGVAAAVNLAVGHSAGFHRGVIHGAYKMHLGTARCVAWLASMAGIGGPIALLRMHNTRDNHQNTPTCPDYYTFAHSAARDASWYLFHVHNGPVASISDRWATDPVFNLIERTWVWQQLLLACVLFALGGVSWAVWGVGVRAGVCVVGHWLVNYLAHTRGYRRWRMPGSGEEGRNHLLFGALAMGEGWHNNHHAWPDSARFGMAWWELDPGWWVVRAMAAVGLAWDVKTPEDGATLRAGAVHCDEGCL